MAVCKRSKVLKGELINVEFDGCGVFERGLGVGDTDGGEGDSGIRATFEVRLGKEQTGILVGKIPKKCKFHLKF